MNTKNEVEQFQKALVLEKVKDRENLLALQKKFVNPVLEYYTDIVAVSGYGSYLTDSIGERYLDFASGIAANSLGHCHPKVVEAIQKQAKDLIHTSVTAMHKPYIYLAEKLSQITPDGLDVTFLANSGAEAVDGAIKMARYVTDRPAIINFKGGFHGRTMMATALTTSKLYHRENLEPLPGPIYTVPFPGSNTTVEAAMIEVEKVFDLVNPDQVASMIIEPIQGEGGYVIPPAGFLTALKHLCHKFGILLIADEVQTGFGRTGEWFAVDHEKLSPDILVVAKGIAGGMPLSAFITTKDIASEWKPARHGSTFGGNPLSCAAALATIQVIKEEGLVSRAMIAGDELLYDLKLATQGNDYVVDVRGKGLMIGVEFVQPNPQLKIAQTVMKRCLKDNLLILNCGHHGEVIRLIPPLTVEDSEINTAMYILQKAMKFNVVRAS